MSNVTAIVWQPRRNDKTPGNRVSQLYRSGRNQLQRVTFLKPDNLTFTPTARQDPASCAEGQSMHSRYGTVVSVTCGRKQSALILWTEMEQNRCRSRAKTAPLTRRWIDPTLCVTLRSLSSKRDVCEECVDSEESLESQTLLTEALMKSSHSCRCNQMHCGKLFPLTLTESCMQKTPSKGQRCGDLGPLNFGRDEGGVGEMVYNGEKKHGGEWLVVVGREEDAEDERGQKEKGSKESYLQRQEEFAASHRRKRRLLGAAGPDLRALSKWKKKKNQHSTGDEHELQQSQQQRH
ncbi:hypothetical protein F2P81_015926 [Scophthalmus maximus]|uniref:Uncharacterized protein n=1 Tax=Scophthalmus maximus TaxID=52904 RepID=A0A6A4SJS1_SCOMX|nr:hypothetical protein F2P81_015926 [Scophthalmus maximus]